MTYLDQPPPTRAKSPKLGRRKSRSGALNSSNGNQVKGAVVQENYHIQFNDNEDGSFSIYNNNRSDKNDVGDIYEIKNNTKHIGETNAIRVNGQVDLEISSQS